MSKTITVPLTQEIPLDCVATSPDYFLVFPAYLPPVPVREFHVINPIDGSKFIFLGEGWFWVMFEEFLDFD